MQSPKKMNRFVTGSLEKLLPPVFFDTYRKHRNNRDCLKYKGNEVYCPVCKSEFKSFIPAGIIKRPNAKCPRCRSLERHRLLFMYLDRELKLFDSRKKLRILHFAPEEPCYNLLSDLDNVEYYPCDLHPNRYNFARKTEIYKVDITHIQFTDDFFDFIICSHVLEHIPDDKKAVQELYRIMKLDGGGYIQVPVDYRLEKTYEDFSITSPRERQKAFGHYEHVRQYGRDYVEKLRENGFLVKEDN